MEYLLARDEQSKVLNPYQSAYLLLDNGLDHDAGNIVHNFRSQFDDHLSDVTMFENGKPTCTGVLI